MNTPPLLMGTALLFWGWQTGFIFWSVAMALVVEGFRLTQRRWHLSPKDFHRLADLCALIVLGMTAYRFMAGTASMARWLPIALFPLLAGQVYSTTAGVDLGAFFYTVRQREKRTPPARRRTRDIAYPCLFLIVLAASAANVRTAALYTGAAVLGAWALWSVRPRRSPVLFAALLLVAVALGYGGGVGLHRLQIWLETDVIAWLTGQDDRDRNPSRNLTAMGDIGRLKQKDRIVMRVRTIGTYPWDRLLHEASYNRFTGKLWVAGHAGFNPIRGPSDAHGNRWRIAPAPDGALCAVDIERRLKDGTGILSLPHGCCCIQSLPAGRLERNGYGAFRVSDAPEHIAYRALFLPRAVVQQAPLAADLTVPEKEAAAVASELETLDTAGCSPPQIAERIQSHFRNRFRYDLDQQRPGRGQSALAHFLRSSRAGHCEFFATATVLLLRSAGIPARYATGYAAMEYSRLEKCIVVRSRHAHAWAIAYWNDRWHTVDSTPPSWPEMERQRVGLMAPVIDFFRWTAYRFRLWRETIGAGPITGRWMWPAAVLLAAAVIGAARRRRVIRKNTTAEKQPESATGTRPVSAFDAVARCLADNGWPRHRWEPAGEWLDRLARAGLDRDLIGDLQPVVRLHYRLCFHPGGLSAAQTGAMEKRCGTLQEKIRRRHGSAYPSTQPEDSEPRP